MCERPERHASSWRGSCVNVDLLLQVGRVQLVVPVRVVAGAAQRVRAAARHHRDGEPRAVPLRGVEVRRLDANLLNLVGVGRARDAAAEAVVHGAVDRVVVARVAAVEAAAGADLAARGARRAFHVALEDVLHLGFGRRDAGREARQHDRHVREHRQRLDQAAIEVLAGGDGGRVDQRGLSRDRDLLAELTDFQLQVRLTVWPTASEMPVWVNALKPCNSTRTAYVPGFSRRASK